MEGKVQDDFHLSQSAFQNYFQRGLQVRQGIWTYGPAVHAWKFSNDHFRFDVSMGADSHLLYWLFNFKVRQKGTIVLPSHLLMAFIQRFLHPQMKDVWSICFTMDVHWRVQSHFSKTRLICSQKKDPRDHAPKTFGHCSLMGTNSSIHVLIIPRQGNCISLFSFLEGFKERGTSHAITCWINPSLDVDVHCPLVYACLIQKAFAPDLMSEVFATRIVCLC